jgi:hypothetical protein
VFGLVPPFAHHRRSQQTPARACGSTHGTGRCAARSS